MVDHTPLTKEEIEAAHVEGLRLIGIGLMSKDEEAFRIVLDLQAAHKRIAELDAWKFSIENAMAGAMDETCDANTMHCTCVPVLRATVTRGTKISALHTKLVMTRCPACQERTLECSGSTSPED